MATKSPFAPGAKLDIYTNQNRFKWTILVIALIIGFTSIYYTNRLVAQLRDREQKLIQLFAKTIEYTANENEDQNLSFIFEAVIVPNNSIPVIWTDGLGNPIEYRNIKIKPGMDENSRNRFLKDLIEEMKTIHDPIAIHFSDQAGNIIDQNFVYYKNSFLLDQLRYYPYIQLSIIGIFGMLAYLVFNYSKTAEQNRIWVGLAKETAHQLGTPISSLIAWHDFLQSEENIRNLTALEELDKDIKRLEMITSRFSSIGSTPILNNENITESVLSTVTYLQNRLSEKVKINLTARPKNIRAMINRPLFDWVIENLCKNAVDAMSGIGSIDINIRKSPDGNVIIDVSDTGKGIPKSKIRHIFQPGYTTKSRGWGLGLTLVKRIVENYHGGKISVKSTELGGGTTFRIILKS